jgi:hypothetical protein
MTKIEFEKYDKYVAEVYGYIFLEFLKDIRLDVFYLPFYPVDKKRLLKFVVKESHNIHRYCLTTSIELMD